MKKENILVMALICLAFLGVWTFFSNGTPNKGDNDAFEVSASGAGTGSGIDFKTYSEGMRLAESLKRPVFLYFYADW